MRIALLGHAPVLGGSTDLLFQARDFFLQRSHRVHVIFGAGAKPADPRSRDATIFDSKARDWRGKMRDYVRLVEGFRPDIAYAFSGAQELDLFRFLSCARVRHVSSLEQHGYADIPCWLTENCAYFEACTANSPDAMEEVHRYTHLPTFLWPYRLPEMDSSGPKIEIPRAADKTAPVEVAFVARLERFQKRAHWLPEIVRRCASSGVQLNWHIYGDGPEGPTLRRKLEKASNVTFHGWMDRQKIYQLLPQHDLFFLCSRWEGLPISMVEAMRCGLASVAPDIPAGIRWTLGHGGGWLYEAKSPRAAAEALVSAARDRDLILKKRREALRLSTELFSPAQAEKNYLQLELAMEKLTFNGHVLDPATAPRFRTVPFSGYLRRAAYAAESVVVSPGKLLAKARKKLGPKP